MGGKNHKKIYCVMLVFYYWCFISLSFLDRKSKFETFGPQLTTQVTCYSKEEVLWMTGSSNPTSEWSQKIIFCFKHNLRFRHQIHCRWTEHVLNFPETGYLLLERQAIYDQQSSLLLKWFKRGCPLFSRIRRQAKIQLFYLLQKTLSVNFFQK